MIKSNWLLKKMFLIALAVSFASANGSAFSQNRGSYERASPNSSTNSWRIGHKYEHIEGYVPKPDSIKELSVSFDPPKLGKLGNLCNINGTLKFRQQDDSEPIPVNWFQGVSIYLHRTPNENAGWPSVIDEGETDSECVILKNDGSFEIDFDLRETFRNPSHDQEFELAFVFAKHRPKGRDGTSQSIIWNPDPATKADIVNPIKIPASPVLSRELRLINEACRWPFYDPNSTKLIRAVNALQPLGKKKALSVLTKYLSLTDEMNTDDHEIAFWIIRLLFEPVNLDDRIPSPAIAVVILNDNRKENKFNWPLYPIELVDGIPFMVGQQIAMGGFPEPPQSHIRWVEQYGVMRNSPISPSGNPLLAAEKLMATEKFKAIKETWGHSKVRHIREQAFGCLGIEIPEDEHEWPDLSEDVWNKALNSDKANYKWIVSSQQFEPSAKPDR